LLKNGNTLKQQFIQHELKSVEMQRDFKLCSFVVGHNNWQSF